MTKPSECIWCGLELLDDTTHDTIFSCGTVQHPRSDCWSQSTGCEEIMRSRERIQRADQDIEMVKAREANAVTALQSHTRALESRIQQAVAVLEGARRYDFVDGYLPCMSRRSDGEFVEHEEARQALEILRGNSSESPDNSPVTADDLAAADYYEAVRQRVPWMTSIEHIEDLIEGHRQCGVMVWKAAEQVKLIFGGGNGETE